MAMDGKTRGHFPARIAILCSLLRPGWPPPQPSIKQVPGGLSPGVKRGRVFVALCHSTTHPPPNTSSWSAVKAQGTRASLLRRRYENAAAAALFLLLLFCYYYLFYSCIFFSPTSVTKF